MARLKPCTSKPCRSWKKLNTESTEGAEQNEKQRIKKRPATKGRPFCFVAVGSLDADELFGLAEAEDDSTGILEVVLPRAGKASHEVIDLRHTNGKMIADLDVQATASGHGERI